MLWNLYMAELLESYVTFPETYPLQTFENRSCGTCYLTCTRPRWPLSIYKIFHRITPSCLERLTQRRQNKYDFRHHHRVSFLCFETYNMKNTISYRGSHAWNLLDPSVANTRAKIAINSQARKNLNFSAESPLAMNMFNDIDFVYH